MNKLNKVQIELILKAIKSYHREPDSDEMIAAIILSVMLGKNAPPPSANKGPIAEGKRRADIECRKRKDETRTLEHELTYLLTSSSEFEATPHSPSR